MADNIFRALIPDASTETSNTETNFAIPVEEFRVLRRNISKRSFFVIFISETCSHCQTAINYLLQYRLMYRDFDAEPFKTVLRALTKNLNPRSPMSVPIVFVDGVYIGGKEELIKVIQAIMN
jgi:glutaredoxin